VQECRVHVRDALTRFCSDIWSIEFDRANVDAIANPHCRSLIERAEHARTEGDSAVAVAWLRETLAYAVSRAAKVLVGGKVRAEGFGITIGGRLGELGADLADVVRSLQSTTNLVALGVDLITYRRFMHLAAGAPGVFPNGQVIRGQNDPQLSADDMEFAFGYVTNEVNAIEEFVGDLDNPFEGALDTPVKHPT
jgi:hypothetical protein